MIDNLQKLRDVNITDKVVPINIRRIMYNRKLREEIKKEQKRLLDSINRT